jgi:hypothetical protein
VKGKRHLLSPFGETLLGEDGLDPFLEDIRTLWLIHWNLSTDVENPLLAWDYLLNQWHEPEFVPRAVLKALHKEANRYNDNLSLVTVEQHFDTFLHTYVPTHGRKREVQEDNLDCPLVELELIVKVGERELDRSSGRREPIYAFRKDEKSDITLALFAYSLYDFWQKRHKTEATLPLREVTYGHGSPGQAFKLSENEVRTRVEGLQQQTRGFIYRVSESATNLEARRTEQYRVTERDLLRGGGAWLRRRFPTCSISGLDSCALCILSGTFRTLVRSLTTLSPTLRVPA